MYHFANESLIGFYCLNSILLYGGMHWIVLTESFSFNSKEKNCSSVEVDEINLHKGVYVCMVRLELWSTRSDTVA